MITTHMRTILEVLDANPLGMTEMEMLNSSQHLKRSTLKFWLDHLCELAMATEAMQDCVPAPLFYITLTGKQALHGH